MNIIKLEDNREFATKMIQGIIEVYENNTRTLEQEVKENEELFSDIDYRWEVHIDKPSKS